MSCLRFSHEVKIRDILADRDDPRRNGKDVTFGIYRHHIRAGRKAVEAVVAERARQRQPGRRQNAAFQ